MLIHFQKKDKSLINEIKATLCSKSEIKFDTPSSPRQNSNPSYQGDSLTNIDSYLELDQNDTSSNMEFYTPSNSKSSLNDLSTSIIHPCQDEDIFMKRRYQEIIHFDEDSSPHLKFRHCESLIEEKEQIANFMEIDFPFCLGFQDEKL